MNILFRHSVYLLLGSSFIILLLSSCATPAPDYDEMSRLAKHTLQLDRTQELRDRVSLLNASLVESKDFFQLPPGTKEIEDRRMILVLNTSLDVLGRINTICSYQSDTNIHTDMTLEKISLLDKRRHNDFLWDDLEFNSVVIHELAHGYFCQRYHYIWMDNKSQTSEKSYKIKEGYSVWMSVRWIYNHYTYPRRFFLESIWKKGQEAFEYFNDEFYDADSSTIDWAKLDAYEKSLAPAGYCITPLPISYP